MFIFGFILLISIQEVLSLYCYCAGQCPQTRLNNTCRASLNSQCFSAVEQVFNDATGRLEDERTYGCLPPEETGLMQCKGYLVPHEIPKSIACCSDQDLCNKYLTPNTVSRSSTPSPMYQGEILSYTGPYHLVIFIAATSVCCVILIVVVVCMFIRMRNQKLRNRSYLDVDKSNFGQEALIDKSSDSSGSGSGIKILVQRTIGKQIEMLENIGRGRFGEVWKARLRDECVAVKVFFTSEEASWARETDIYKIVLLRHENILGFIAADIRGNGSWTQMILITDYLELGSLHDYLKVCLLDIAAMLKLAYSASCGLSHLHVEVLGKQGKPAIAHRDIKSRNILIKKDLTCAIADFGLAVKYRSDINEIDIAANTRVGTRRYMSPEILDDKLNASRFESFLMADMYAFALVLWEIARRCIVNGNVDDYQLPFYEYVPSNPSFEDMKKVVCVDQTRPTIPKHWSDSGPMQIVGKLIQECWSQNPGARLTAFRVKKTLSKLESQHRDTKLV